MRRWSFGLVGALLAMTLTACGGGAVATNQALGGAGAQARASVRFTILAPAATQSLGRKPSYLSPSMQSVVIGLATLNGAPYTGSSANFAVNLTTGNPACTIVGGVLTCTILADGVIGNDGFIVTTYDATQSGSNPTSPQGNVLSKGSVIANVNAGQANPVSLTLNAVVASVALSLAPGTITSGTPTVANLTVNALDAGGNTIVGPYLDATGAPLTITLTDTDASGTTAISQTSITAPTVGITVSYSGAAISRGAVIAASAPGVSSGTAVLYLAQAFNYTGGSQTFTVPAGEAQLAIVAAGAQGGGGAMGGSVTAMVPVVSGETLTIFVGGTAAGAGSSFNGGGDSGNDGCNSGGGGGCDNGYGGGGGGLGGQTATGGTATNAGGGGGTGATASVAGTAGSAGNGTGGNPNGFPGAAGTLGSGGAGGGSGAIGGIQGNCSGLGGSGGGGGYYGGGGGGGGGAGAGGGCGGNGYGGGGGGGGSSFAEMTATGVSYTTGTQGGNGVVTILY